MARQHESIFSSDSKPHSHFIFIAQKYVAANDDNYLRFIQLKAFENIIAENISETLQMLNADFIVLNDDK